MLKKRIGRLFMAHGGGGAVAGVNNSVCGKSEDFFTNAGEKLVLVASRKIPAADAIGEQNVPAIQLAESGKIQAEAAGTVAGDEE